METQAWPLILLTASLVITTLFLHHLRRRRRRRPKRNSPPGPKAWPVIGNLHQVGPLPHRSLHSLSQTYGPLFQLRFGSRPVVVASSPRMAEQFLKTHDEIFASRPALAAGKYTSFNFSDVSWSSYGPYWRQGRKLFLNEIFSHKKLKSYDYILEEEKSSFIRRLYSAGGTDAIALRDELTRYTLSSISRIVMGNIYVGSATEIGELQELIDEWFFLGGAITLGDWIPWLGFLDIHGYVKRMKSYSKKVDVFYSYVINDHKRKKKGNIGGKEKDDMVDALLKLANDPNLEVKLTHDGLKALIQVLNSLCTSINTIIPYRSGDFKYARVQNHDPCVDDWLRDITSITKSTRQN